VTGVGYGAAGVMGAEANTVTVPEPTRLPCTACNIYGVPCLLELPIGWPMLTDWRALGPLVSVGGKLRRGCRHQAPCTMFFKCRVSG
jgi:hypothetical protein